uniref:SMB domain-containing protein n=1 Tax=Heterosigma akashiwo TaxID=2829 RepID=A0A7S4DB36_HETAK
MYYFIGGWVWCRLRSGCSITYTSSLQRRTRRAWYGTCRRSILTVRSTRRLPARRYGAEYGGYDSYGTYYDDRVWSHKWLIFDDDNYYYDPWVGAEGVYVEDYHIESALAGVSGGNVSAVGVPAHETAHFLGLPDLYDTDYSSSGIDTWGLMANSWGWDYTGELPPSLSGWSKVELGWINVWELNSTWFNNSDKITTYVDEIHDPWWPYVMKVAFPYTPGEYLLLEYRMALENDRGQPADGLLVWHIDETVENNDDEGYYGDGTFPSSHYQVALIQADGAFDLEQGYSADSGDVFIEGDRLFNSLEAHPSSMGYLGGVGYTSGLAMTVFREGEWLAESWTTSWGDHDNYLMLNISFTNATSTANATIDGSCQDSCGGQGSNGTASCWCDSSCSFWGDCCDDFDDHCDYGSSTASPTPDEDVFCSDDNDCGSDEYCYCSGEEEARRRRKLRANGSKGGSTKSGRSGRKPSSTSAAKKGRHSGNSGGFGGHSSAKTHHHAGKRSLLFTADSCYCVDNA